MKLKLTFALLVALAAIFIDPTFAVAGVLLTTTTAQLGNGTTLQVSLGSPTSLVSVANVNNITFMDGTSAEVDASNLTSTWKERLLGLPDAGVVQFELQTDLSDPGQSALLTAKNTRTKCTFKITLPGGPTPNATFDGYVRKFNVNASLDAVVKTQCELLVTGPVTLS
jgi:hypothetical protein